MNSLLSAGFSRLFKSVIFRLCVIAMAAVSAFMTVYRCITDPMDFEGNNHLLFYGENMTLFYAAAVFVGFFSGAEHSGGIRNKLIVGHSRVSLYFSELTVCSCGVGIIQAAHAAGVIIPAFILGGGISFKEGTLTGELMIFALLIGISALFLAFTLLIPKKVVGTVAALLLVTVSFNLDQELNQKIFRLENGISSGRIYAEGTGEREQMNKDPDGETLTEAKKLKTIKAALPFGQLNEINHHYDFLFPDEQLISAGFDPEEVYQFSESSRTPLPLEGAACSFSVYTVITAAAAMIFRKKDMR